jgi:antitoxin component of MazEF toxin-antitoxin module
MLKNLTTVGDAQALILPPEVLAALGIGESGQIEMQVLGNTVLLSLPRTQNLQDFRDVGTTPSSLDMGLNMALAYARVKTRREALFKRLAHQGHEQDHEQDQDQHL